MVVSLQQHWIRHLQVLISWFHEKALLQLPMAALWKTPINVLVASNLKIYKVEICLLELEFTLLNIFIFNFSYLIVNNNITIRGNIIT